MINKKERIWIITMKKQATKIKICGLTKEKEADYLNQIHADFAGMVVFFSKSKRNISLDQAKKIKSALLPEIKTVAVTVSPTLAQISQIAEAGFDLIQIHGDPVDLDIVHHNVILLKAVFRYNQ